MEWNKCIIVMEVMSKKSLTSRKSPSIDWDMSINSGVEPSIDCACKEESQKIEIRTWPKTKRLKIIQTWYGGKAKQKAHITQKHK